MTDPDDVETAVVDAHRRGWALALAATARVARDLDVAEECVQEAYAAALVSWARDGIPDKPAAWLTTTAKRRAMDAVRREQVFRSKLPLLVEPEEVVDEITMDEPVEPVEQEDVVPDERLRLIFLCCHRALAQDAQLALTLRLVCGVSTGDVAKALLVSEPTMAARITRAKKKISTARIPYRMPGAAELPDRLRAVLAVIHLLFTAGHTAPSGTALVRADLVDQALHLARMLRDLMPDEREVWGLLALLLVTDARRAGRVDSDGRLLRLEDQDRSLWDRAAIAEAQGLIVDGLRGGRPRRYVLQAAIASLYAEAPTYDETDWPQIVTLYDELLLVWPSPVVALNRTVAVAMVSGPARSRVDQQRSRASIPGRAPRKSQPAVAPSSASWGRGLSACQLRSSARRERRHVRGCGRVTGGRVKGPAGVGVALRAWALRYAPDFERIPVCASPLLTVGDGMRPGIGRCRPGRLRWPVRTRPAGQVSRLWVPRQNLVS